MRLGWLALALAISAPAWGQSEDEIEKNAGAQLDAYMWCVRYQISELAKADPTATDQQVKARAGLACSKERKAALEQLQKAPLGMPPAEATEHLNEAVAAIKPGIPKSREKSEPYGTFAQHGQLNFDDRSGYFEWDDMLAIRSDGTAEMNSRFKSKFHPGWYLKGCHENQTAGSALVTQKFSVEIQGATVSLKRQGPIGLSKVQPPCWNFPTTALEGIFKSPTQLDWIDGRLKNNDGEYFRQD